MSNQTIPCTSLEIVAVTTVVTWPQFAYYDGLDTSERTPLLVDSRMANPYRYLNGSKKDFFALFVADLAA